MRRYIFLFSRKFRRILMCSGYQQGLQSNRCKNAKHLFLTIIIGIGVINLTGCGDGLEKKPTEIIITSAKNSAESSMREIRSSIEEAETDTAVLSEESQDETEKEPEEESEGKTEKEPEEESAKESEQEESGNETVYQPAEAPLLPETGGQLEDFVPEGWEVLDSVELDFNEDGASDYVGVLQEALVDMGGFWTYGGYPRILFAIASDGAGRYCLDFQDINLIRTRDEGGVFGDPYLPLTAEGHSFTTHTYGGSAWRWSEDFTYTYREGNWWLTSSEETYGYGDYITEYSKNDWESGVGIRKKRSSEFDDMQNGVPEEYDVVYELSLDEPLTLEQAGKRWWLAPDRVTEWEVEEIVFAADVDLSEDMVELPDEAYIDYCDENCVLYVSNPGPDSDENSYLAMYCWQDKVLSVLAEEESYIDYPEFYDGKIYYCIEIVENVTYKTMKDGQEQLTEKEDTVGVRLNRMEPDGTGKETLFEYRYQDNGQEIMESRMPYLALIYEISGDEIVAEVYIGDDPHPFYRMNTDGSSLEKIGQMPKE